MLKFITKILGSKSKKDIRSIMPWLEKTRQEADALKSCSHDALRAKVHEVQLHIEEKLSHIDAKLSDTRQQIVALPARSLNEKESLFSVIDRLEKERNEILEKVLMEVLPQAFAIMKETAIRFKQNESLEVTAQDHDLTIAAQHNHVEINGDKAVWHNQWVAADNLITWDMAHYDVQIIGGIVLHQGKIAEMATGEGKTLVATLPAFLNALAKRGVHIVTVNNYLARRDSEWMGPLFQFHGLIVDCIDKYEANSPERRKAYEADITYGTNNEFGFDYLRDNIARSPEELVQRRGLHYAMIDEVDSVLVDEARTPLIISGPIPKGDEHEFYELKPRVHRIIEAQKKIIGQFLNEAKRLIAKGDEKEGGLALFRAHRGLPKYKPLIKFLSEPGIKNKVQKTENYYLQDNKKMMPEADNPLFFIIDEKENSVDLTDKGIDLITGEGEDPDFFILPEISTELNKIEQNPALSTNDKGAKKEQLINEYTIKASRIHSVNQLLKAYTLFEKDTEYIIADGKVKIVDEQTGRVLDGRRYSDGLHQAIEAKENVKVEDATQTYATVTLQNYFRMYHKLAGMTGTAETEAGELWDIYKLDVVVIPTHRKIIRRDEEDMVYKTVREKFNAAVQEIETLTKAKRPVLVGTTSVEISELVSRMLNRKKIPHQVLNAKQHQREAEIVAVAGTPGTVTIATNMAGRGTDIKLTEESKKAGGLAIVGTERHESRRVDRQLRGRSGRQGDPGSSRFYVSLEDTLMRLFMPERIARIMDRLGLKEGEVISHSMVTNSIERAQKKVEENNFGIRKRLLEYDDVMNAQREVIYKRRKNALFGERLPLDILAMLYDACEEIVAQGKASGNIEDFKIETLNLLSFDFQVDKETLEKEDTSILANKLYNAALSYYEQKNKQVAQQALPVMKNIFETKGDSLQDIAVPFADGKKEIAVSVNLKDCVESDNEELIRSMEKTIALSIIDQQWKEHLRDMDDLKQSVQNAVYEQKDPLLIYKFEGFEAFKKFMAQVNQEIVSSLMRAKIALQDPGQVQEAHARKRERLKSQKAESKSLLQGEAAPNQQPPPAEKIMPIKSEKIAGRNDRINVRYTDGRMLKDIKYKKVEADVKSGKCVVVEL